VTHVLCR